MIQREKWGSRWGFILATAGFAVGLGNIWRFPYVAGENGGGAFLLLYLIFAILIGIPLMAAEVSMGRKAQLSPIAGMQKLAGARSPWVLFAWLGILTTVLIMANYVVLIAWVGGYLAMILGGSFPGGTSEEVAARFAEFVADPVPILIFIAALLAFSAFMVSRGLANGLEKIAKLAMPTLLIMLVVLAIRSVTFEGAFEGVAWFLSPDLSELDGQAVLTALGQSFYSIGIGMATAFGLGSYLDPEDSDVPGNSVLIVGCDTAVAFIAGLVIFPALFAFGMAPDSGPTLMFVSMPIVFQEMAGGMVFGGVFLFLLVIAGLTSVLAVMEVLVQVAAESVGWERKRFAVGLGVVWFFMAIPTTLSQGPWSHIQVGGRDLFAALDFAIGSYFVPAGGLMLALYVATSWGWSNFQAETNVGAGAVKVGASWRPFVQFLIPVALVLIFLGGLGIF